MSKCKMATTAKISTLLIRLRPFIFNIHGGWYRSPNGLAVNAESLVDLQSNHVLHLQSVLGWCEASLCPESLRVSVQESVIARIIRYAAPFIIVQSKSIVALGKAVRKAIFRAERLPWDFSKVTWFELALLVPCRRGGGGGGAGVHRPGLAGHPGALLGSRSQGGSVMVSSTTSGHSATCKPTNHVSHVTGRCNRLTQVSDTVSVTLHACTHNPES